MKISIGKTEQTNDEKFIISSFDFYGNLYFTSTGDKSYQVNIDGKNNLFLEEGIYKILSNEEINRKGLVVTKGMDSLSNKILTENENCDNEDNEYNPYSDEDNEKEENDYYPEEDDYYLSDESDSETYDLIYEDIEKKFGNHNKRFNFFSIRKNLDDDELINSREHGDVCALYDTYIYDHNMLCFKSSAQNNDSCYRIKLYSNGNIIFRPIGYSEQNYKLILDNDDNIVLQKI